VVRSGRSSLRGDELTTAVRRIPRYEERPGLEITPAAEVVTVRLSEARVVTEAVDQLPKKGD
jgi:hypothetical protein